MVHLNGRHTHTYSPPEFHIGAHLCTHPLYCTLLDRLHTYLNGLYSIKLVRPRWWWWCSGMRLIFCRDEGPVKIFLSPWSQTEVGPHVGLHWGVLADPLHESCTGSSLYIYIYIRNTCGPWIKRSRWSNSSEILFKGRAHLELWVPHLLEGWDSKWAPQGVPQVKGAHVISPTCSFTILFIYLFFFIFFSL